MDLYHAGGHVADLGKLLYGPRSGEATRWTAARTEDLDAGEVERLVATLERLRPRLAAGQEAIRKALGYFQANTERMRYSSFRRQGLSVGSGVVEAGCKTVIGFRLKQSGMRWTVRGANAIIALRCAELSGRSAEFWEARAAGWIQHPHLCRTPKTLRPMTDRRVLLPGLASTTSAAGAPSRRRRRTVMSPLPRASHQEALISG